MQVEIDIDPTTMSGWDKEIEAWSICHGTRVAVIKASMLGGFNVGTACQQLYAGNNYRSGCTKTQTMTLSAQTTDELWFRKPGFLGVWGDVARLHRSMRAAFGGRSVRFIWKID
jgi:hypothetical protein